MNVACLRPKVMANQMSEFAREDLPQPRAQGFPGAALEIFEPAMGFKTDVLHQVRRIYLALQSPSDLNARQQQQVALMQFQELPADFHIALTCSFERLVQPLVYPRIHGGSQTMARAV